MNISILSSDSCNLIHSKNIAFCHPIGSSGLCSGTYLVNKSSDSMPGLALPVRNWPYLLIFSWLSVHNITCSYQLISWGLIHLFFFRFWDCWKIWVWSSTHPLLSRSRLMGTSSQLVTRTSWEMSLRWHQDCIACGYCGSLKGLIPSMR